MRCSDAQNKLLQQEIHYDYRWYQRWTCVLCCCGIFMCLYILKVISDTINSSFFLFLLQSFFAFMFLCSAAAKMIWKLNRIIFQVFFKESFLLTFSDWFPYWSIILNCIPYIHEAFHKQFKVWFHEIVIGLKKKAVFWYLINQAVQLINQKSYTCWLIPVLKIESYSMFAA